MIASATTLPVIGVPVPLKVLDGMDSLLSIVQMPAGIPVATVGVGNSKNAGLLAARIIGSSNSEVAAKIADLMDTARLASLEKGKSLNAKRNTRTGF
jgi:5-(carboxyamino)imidazole ribonucleotide mutase